MPRLVISGLGGGSGKSLLAVGLAATWRQQGVRVAPFKKGPDYIDAAWLTRAAEQPCHNLDAFLVDEAELLRCFVEHACSAELAVIEGNRGLFDGVDAAGTYSTAALARLLKAPVLLIVDCTKVTRTVAALVKGCQVLDPQSRVVGVVLNRVAGQRQERVIREAILASCGLPVVGAIPKLEESLLPERHLGLLPPTEHADASRAIAAAADVVAAHVDLVAVRQLAEAAELIHAPPGGPAVKQIASPSVCIGVVRDAAFNFYYPENLDLLRRHGAELVEIDALRDPALPTVDALYIGGGFPETQASALSANEGFRRSLRQRIEQGLPVYAECGGLTYLSEAIEVGSQAYPMVGVFGVTFVVEPRPQGHGYVIVEVQRANPFFAVGQVSRGHEFRYSRVKTGRVEPSAFAFRMQRGHGFDGEHDGLCYRNVLACFSHFHALGVPTWAEALVSQARQWRDARRSQNPGMAESASSGLGSDVNSFPAGAVATAAGRC
jgi:cobyrinic acid a,c-diamide synthase